MNGFIVYPTYRIVDNKAYVYLFGRLENGESFLTINYFKPYFFVRKKDKEKINSLLKDLNTIDINNKNEIKNFFSKSLSNGDLKKIHELKQENISIEETHMKTFYSEPVLKIVLNLPKNVPYLRDLFENKGIITYEADIRFVYRFLIDNKIKASLFIKGNYKKGNFVNRIYENPIINPSEFKPNLRVVSIDIECSMDLKNLYCVSFYSKDFSKTLIVNEKNFSNAESFKTEKELLERFKEIILNYDPDIITGWNLIDFDLKILKNKFEEHKLDFTIGRVDWPITIKVFDSFFKESTAEIPGRIALDAMHLLKTSFIGLEDYKLQTAAKEILGDSKILIDEFDKGEEIEQLYTKNPNKLIDYNLKDSELVIKILEKKNIIELTILRSLLTGMQLDRVKSSIASLDNLYIRETQELGYVCPNSSNIEREARIKGGYVKDSIPGIYDFIDVLDFKSLYPSIIRTFNIDPLSFIPKEFHKKYKDNEVIIAPNGAKFKKTFGILPKIIQELWQQRDLAKKENNKEKSYAIKITMNSFFGVLANPNCRFYSLDMANAITYFGQHIVKKTAEIVENKGYKVIYGDTDSIFLETKAVNYENAQKIGKEIANYVNDFWKEHVKNVYDVDSFLELQFEKTFIRFIMPKIRGSDIGAKKRYAGLLLIDGKEKIDFTGLEFVRRDWTELSKKFQLELLDRIFHKKEVSDYIKNFVNDLKKGRYDDLLVYKKAIRKELDNYTKTTPPHVKAARKLGKLTSNIIAYVMTTDGPEPIQQIKHSLDYEHYIEKQIKPIADSILSFYNTTFDELINQTKQTNLFGFQ